MISEKLSNTSQSYKSSDPERQEFIIPSDEDTLSTNYHGFTLKAVNIQGEELMVILDQSLLLFEILQPLID